MGSINPVEWNCFRVVRDSCTDDRIMFPHLTFGTHHEFPTVGNRIERTKNKLKDLPENLPIME
jgi:hypothetical protein